MAKEIFEQNPKLDVIYKTSDKTLFYTELNAKSHARTLENKKVDKVTRESVLKSVNPKSDSNKPNAEQRIETIKGLDTVDAVKAALKGEKATTVKFAGTKRIEELEEITAVSERIDVIKSLDTVEKVNAALENEESEEVLAAGKAKLETFK